MANDRNRTDDLDDISRPNPGSQTGMSDEGVRGGAGDDIRGVADEGDEEFEDTDDLEDEDDSDDASF